jgi:hypothetical protein
LSSIGSGCTNALLKVKRIIGPVTLMDEVVNDNVGTEGLAVESLDQMHVFSRIDVRFVNVGMGIDWCWCC